MLRRHHSEARQWSQAWRIFADLIHECFDHNLHILPINQFPSYCPSLQSRHRDIVISLLSPLAILSIDTQPNILGTSYSTIRAIRHFHHFSSDLIFRYGIYFLLSSVANSSLSSTILLVQTIYSFLCHLSLSSTTTSTTTAILVPSHPSPARSDWVVLLAAVIRPSRGAADFDATE